MICLDTYALIEIKNNNPKYLPIINRDFIVTSYTLSEFYWVLLKDEDKDIADAWFHRFRPFGHDVDIYTLINAMDYKNKFKKQKLSFFDCVGYVFAKKKNIEFVTGDKEFKNKTNVMFIKS